MASTTVFAGYCDGPYYCHENVYGESICHYSPNYCEDERENDALLGALPFLFYGFGDGGYYGYGGYGGWGHGGGGHGGGGHGFGGGGHGFGGGGRGGGGHHR